MVVIRALIGLELKLVLLRMHQLASSILCRLAVGCLTDSRSEILTPSEDDGMLHRTLIDSLSPRSSSTYQVAIDRTNRKYQYLHAMASTTLSSAIGLC